MDEAAIDFADNARKQLYSKDYAIASIADYDHGCIDGFKAGAEWMAGQGYTKEGIARPDDCEIWVNFTDTDIRDGDEVIVQIRKK